MMSGATEETERLRQLWSAFRRLKFPSVRAAEELLGDDAYDLLDAEGYIAGLVDTFLTRRGRIAVALINFDPAAHRRGMERLAAERTTDFSTFLEYVNLVGELAMSLSRASGIPLRSSA